MSEFPTILSAIFHAVLNGSLNELYKATQSTACDTINDYGFELS